MDRNSEEYRLMRDKALSQLRSGEIWGQKMPTGLPPLYRDITAPLVQLLT